ncbi:hypothetical protein D3C80_1473050 [compost metagenome]
MRLSISAGMSTQVWWLLTARYEVSLRRFSTPRMSHWVGMHRAKMALSISDQVSATHITAHEA